MTDLTKVPDHAAAIHKAGGPKWYEWCDLSEFEEGFPDAEGMLIGRPVVIYNDDTQPEDRNHFYCPPACEAAVIAYAGEVRAWWLRKGYWSDVSPDEGTEQWETVVDCDNPLERGRFVNYFDTQLAAALALIEAVAGEVGG